MREGTSNILRTPFAESDIDQLPRKVKKGTPDERTILLDYVGHAAVTARLLDADENWTWEPFALAEDGLPRIARVGDCWELWVRLTIDGTTRPGVGTVPVDFDREGNELPADQDTAKELIGDAIRNAAMRFGVALDLWRKHAPGEAPPAAKGKECPHCHADSVLFNAEPRGKKPAWSCSNRGCGGGSPRKEGGGNWPWGSYDADFFTKKDDLESGGPVERGELTGPGAAPPDSWESPNLVALGITKDQAEAELESYRKHPGFHAGTIAEIRSRVERATTLVVALGESEGLLGELWADFKSQHPEAVTWSTAKAHLVMDFARFVQEYLRTLPEGGET